jgi:hypothetical protein
VPSGVEPAQLAAAIHLELWRRRDKETAELHGTALVILPKDFKAIEDSIAALRPAVLAGAVRLDIVATTNMRKGWLPGKSRKLADHEVRDEAQKFVNRKCGVEERQAWPKRAALRVRIEEARENGKSKLNVKNYEKQLIVMDRSVDARRRAQTDDLAAGTMLVRVSGDPPEAEEIATATHHLLCSLLRAARPSGEHRPSTPCGCTPGCEAATFRRRIKT